MHPDNLKTLQKQFLKSKETHASIQAIAVEIPMQLQEIALELKTITVALLRKNPHNGDNVAIATAREIRNILRKELYG
jgi:hypothetical protein